VLSALDSVSVDNPRNKSEEEIQVGNNNEIENPVIVEKEIQAGDDSLIENPVLVEEIQVGARALIKNPVVVETKKKIVSKFCGCS